MKIIQILVALILMTGISFGQTKSQTTDATTGQFISPSSALIISGNGLATTANSVTSISGTTNQINVSSPTGAVVITLPSTVHIASGLDVGSGGIQFGDGGIAGTTLGAFYAVSNGVFRLLDSSGGGSPSVVLGSQSNSNVLFKRNGTTFAIRLGDDSADGNLSAANGTFSGTINGLTIPTTTGTLNIGSGVSLTASSSGTLGSAAFTATSAYDAAGSTKAWSLITSTPTTVSGYGITDGVTLTGTQTMTNKTITSPTLNGTLTGTAFGSGVPTALGNLPNATGGILSLDSNGLGQFDARFSNRNGFAICIAGDSITKPTSPFPTYADVFANLSFAKNHATTYNLGHSSYCIGPAGGGLGSLITAYTTDVHPHRATSLGGDGGLNPICILEGGTNDIGINNATTSQLEGYFSTYSALAIADGFTFIPCTIMPRAMINSQYVFSTSQETTRQTVNAWIATNYPGSYVDFATFMNNPDSSQFCTDGLHPNTAGWEAMGNYLNRFFYTQDPAFSLFNYNLRPTPYGLYSNGGMLLDVPPNFTGIGTITGSSTNTLVGSSISLTGTIAAFSAQITGLSSTGSLTVGMSIAGGAIPVPALIQSVDSSTQVTMSTTTGNSSPTSESIVFGTPFSSLLAGTIITSTSTGPYHVKAVTDNQHLTTYESVTSGPSSAAWSYSSPIFGLGHSSTLAWVDASGNYFHSGNGQLGNVFIKHNGTNQDIIESNICNYGQFQTYIASGTACEIGLQSGGFQFSTIPSGSSFGSVSTINNIGLIGPSGDFSVGASLGSTYTAPSSPLLWVKSNGNALLGSATDSGDRLQVNGSLKVQDGGVTIFHSGTNQDRITSNVTSGFNYGVTGSANSIQISNGTITFQAFPSGTGGTGIGGTVNQLILDPSGIVTIQSLSSGGVLKTNTSGTVSIATAGTDYGTPITVQTGTLSSGTATKTVPAGCHPWVQDNASSLTNVGSLVVTVSGTLATITSTNVLDTSPFTLFNAGSQ